MKQTLPLFALLAASFAAEAPKPQIIIEARFTETDVKTGKEDVLSSPRITTRDGQAAKIEIAHEMMMSVPETTLKDATMKFQTGVELEMIGWIEGDGLILRGTATIRELDGKIAATKDGGWAHLRTDEVPFVLRFKDGEPRQLPISTSARSDRKLKIELTTKKHVPVNASPLYWQAFAAMPKLSDAEKKLLDSKTAGEAERALVAKADAALKLLAEASRADFCDWNLDLTKGPSLALPHLATARELAKLALLQARLNAAAGGRESDPQVPLSVMILARHVGSSPLLVSRLVDLSIEAMAIDEFAAILPRLSEQGRQVVQLRAIDYLGDVSSVSIADCVAEEGKAMSAWLSNELDAELKKGGALDVRAWLSRILAPGGSNSEQMLAELEKTGPLPKDAEEVRRLIDDYRAQMKELARVIGLPRDQISKEAAALEQKLGAGKPRNVFIALLAPSFLKAREAELKGERRLALLRAALDVQAKGETALPADLATFRKTEHGFELTSKELFDGKPVVLTVGPR